jgi:hypothetical protein
MGLHEHPEAVPLLDDADLSPDAVRSCAGRRRAKEALWRRSGKKKN